MKSYTLQITQEFRVSGEEIQKVFDILDKTPQRILLIMDTEGNHHLFDWNYVTESHYLNERVEKILRPEYVPEHLPEMEKIS